MPAAQHGHRVILQLGHQLPGLKCSSLATYGDLLGLRLALNPGGALRVALSSSSNCSSRSISTARQKSPFRRIKALLHNYKQLSKFKLSALVALTASAGFAAGSGDSVDIEKLAWTSLGTFGAAACANTFNQLYEVVNDSRMARTCNRPLPAGRMSPKHALVFALVSGAAGLWILAEQTNPLTTALGAANIMLYAGIYTPVKQLSVFNTWVGAVVGAIPPLMGWAAAAGELEPGAWLLAAALFSWQMPHFLALAWMCQDDYARGGFKMLPSIDPTGRRTAAVALRHCAFLMPLGAIAVALHVASPWFAAEAAVLAAAMGAGAVSFRAHPTSAGARKLFRGSLLYLPLLLAALAVHRQPNRHAVTWQDVQSALEQQAVHLQEAVQPVLPEQIQPGRIWQQLQELQADMHWPKLRPIEERYGLVLDVQRQIQSMKCPSRAYGDSKECNDAASTAAEATCAGTAAEATCAGTAAEATCAGTAADSTSGEQQQ